MLGTVGTEGPMPKIDELRDNEKEADDNRNSKKNIPQRQPKLNPPEKQTRLARSIPHLGDSDRKLNLQHPPCRSNKAHRHKQGYHARPRRPSHPHIQAHSYRGAIQGSRTIHLARSGILNPHLHQLNGGWLSNQRQHILRASGQTQR